MVNGIDRFKHRLILIMNLQQMLYVNISQLFETTSLSSLGQRSLGQRSLGQRSLGQRSLGQRSFSLIEACDYRPMSWS